MVLRDPTTGELAVYIASELMDDESPGGIARYRMTVAEELAHLKLHREAIDGMEKPDDFRKLHNHPQWTEIERNAKRFAAAILIPPKHLSLQAREGYSEIVGVLNRQGITPTQPVVEKWLCTRLAKRFEVSETAMRIRMREWPEKITDKIASAISDGLDYLL